MKNLDDISLKITIEELEGLVKKYYLNLDDSIKDATVNYYLETSSGTYDSFWQYEIGGHDYIYMKVELKREETLFGEVKTFNDYFTLDSHDLIKILNKLLEKDRIVVKYISGASFDINKVYLTCIRKSKDNKKEVKKSKDLLFLKSLKGCVHYIFDETIDISERALVKLLKL